MDRESQLEIFFVSIGEVVRLYKFMVIHYTSLHESFLGGRVERDLVLSNPHFMVA